ncbi:helix-turn-helix domain-containing protein [Streptomyces lavenduligriseus]|uniref:Helix-turn-helix domain-containing protein n=1 Tax=Streptomyces lavenduligriseus TaxID=67315 RepID=A0ABT0P633_9ACTN|nr:helix-turn-helix transcriptional regulator [Streptomyces lavenduligriseus]MCL3998881.1 helix-turn-helix domain-containing protein [Streptomyces lavenduligriseus]
MSDVVVGAVLRAAREQAGVSVARAAVCAGLREARILRLEAAQTAWSAEQAITLARLYRMPDAQVEELRQLLVPRHHHVLPDLGAHVGPRLAALESRAVSIRVAARTLPLFFYGWGADGTYLTDCPDAGLPAVRPRPWPGCPVTLLWDELMLEYGYIDAPRTAARLRHLAGMVESGALAFRILVPDFHQPYEPVGSELTLDDTTSVCVSEELFLVTYSNGPRAREKSDLLDRQLAAALGPEQSLAALRRAAERWDRA